MRCPRCKCQESKVVDTRPNEDNSWIKRRRECESCASRFTTYERIEDAPIIIVKKNGEEQLYYRDKLKLGIIKACEKRPVSEDVILDILQNVEKAMKKSGDTKIKSSFIGEYVMNELKKTDEIAYVRYAAVYKKFKDLYDWQEYIKTTLEK